MSIRIAILGTRGIPNHYGGFEQIAGYLARGLVEKGHQVTVYNTHKHPYTKDSWNGVRIIHCFDPSYLVGTAGQFIYDFNCIRHARRENFDVIIMMGYTSSSIWGRLYPENSIVITNMDGLEWKRTKYNRLTQRFLQYAEKLAVKYSHAHIADSLGVKKYLQDRYPIHPTYIPYGAEIITELDETIIDTHALIKGEYHLLIARMEPENNIEMILSGFCAGNSPQTFVVVGNTSNSYGRYLLNKFGHHPRIKFIGAVFDITALHTLRYYCHLYFHGHSVGGTNPSLLEAMAAKALIVAHDNVFNKHILGEDALYFSSAKEITVLIEKGVQAEEKARLAQYNFNKILDVYNWPSIVDEYEKLIYSYCNISLLEAPVLHTRYAG